MTQGRKFNKNDKPLWL